MEPVKMKPDQERVHTLLTDTVTLLCKNGLHFNQGIVIQGVIGVTIDDHEVFIVHIDKEYSNSQPDTNTYAVKEEAENDEQMPVPEERFPATKKRKLDRFSSNPDEQTLDPSAMNPMASSQNQEYSVSTSYFPPEMQHNDPMHQITDSDLENLLGNVPSAAAAVKTEQGTDDNIIFVKSEESKVGSGAANKWQGQYAQDIDSNTNNDWDGGQFKKEVGMMQNAAISNEYNLPSYNFNSNVSLNSADSTFAGNEYGPGPGQQQRQRQQFPYPGPSNHQQMYSQNLPVKMETPYPLSSAFEAGSSSYLMPDVKPDLNWQGMPKPPSKAGKGTPRAKRGGNTNRGGKTPSAPPAAQQSFNPDAPPHESWEAMVTTSYVCKICESNFTHKSNLLGHQIRVHGRQKNRRGRPSQNSSQTGNPSSDDQDQEYMEPNEQW